MHEKRNSETALSLMQRALDVLDAGGHHGPAIRVQQAIDELTGAPIPRTEAEVDMFLASPAGRALQDRLAAKGGESIGDA